MSTPLKVPRRAVTDIPSLRCSYSIKAVSNGLYITLGGDGTLINGGAAESNSAGFKFVPGSPYLTFQFAGATPLITSYQGAITNFAGQGVATGGTGQC